MVQNTLDTFFIKCYLHSSSDNRSLVVPKTILAHKKILVFTNLDVYYETIYLYKYACQIYWDISKPRSNHLCAIGITIRTKLLLTMELFHIYALYPSLLYCNRMYRVYVRFLWDAMGWILAQYKCEGYYYYYWHAVVKWRYRPSDPLERGPDNLMDKLVSSTLAIRI